MARVLASVRFAIPLILLATVGLRSEPSAVGQSASPDPAGEAAGKGVQAPKQDAVREEIRNPGDHAEHGEPEERGEPRVLLQRQELQ